MSLREKIYNTFSISNKANYGPYKGSSNTYNIFLWNIIYPGRLFNRFRGSTLIKKKFDRKFYYLKSNDEYNFWKKKFEEFNEDGCVIFENYFDPNTIDSLYKKYKDQFKHQSDTIDQNRTKSSSVYLKITQELINIWLDDNLIGLMKNFSTDDLLARNYPVAVLHKNFDEQISSHSKYKQNIKSSYADDWHIDHSNLITMHVILKDITENDICMEFLPKSKRFFNQTYLYSDEEIKKIAIPKKCIGKKGTVYIHYGNTIHRMRTKNNSSRFQLHFEFTSKTNVLLDSKKISETITEGFDFNIEPKKRNICRGIYPLSLNKGYDVSKSGEFKKSKNII